MLDNYTVLYLYTENFNPSQGNGIITILKLRNSKLSKF